MEIGKHIARYRKEQGIKQEELARQIGVSPQAVSKWENGGAPDTALLPEIARVLGVSIDALFGMETQAENWRKYAVEEFRQLEEADRIEQICRFMWELQKNLSNGEGMRSFANGLDYVEDEKDGIYDPKQIGHATLCSDWGLMSANVMESFHYSLVMPEPKRGFGSVLLSDEEYKELFQTLGRPGRMKVLLWMYTQKGVVTRKSAVSLESVAKHTGLSQDVVLGAVSDLCRLKLMQSIQVEIDGRSQMLYWGTGGSSLLPALYFCREMLLETQSTYMGMLIREEPLFRK